MKAELNDRTVLFLKFNLSTKLNGSKYCYVSVTIQLNISHLFTQLNDLTVQFQSIRFWISHLFAHSLNVKQFYLTHGRSGTNGNEGLLRIPQNPSITGALPSDCLMSYPRHSLVEGGILQTQPTLMSKKGRCPWRQANMIIKIMIIIITTDHLISARRPDLLIIKNKKENLQNCGFCCPGWPQSKVERKRKER